uniref:Sam68 tyrosine-rich domain-containing protein n=1 Tax=Sinocyclocheilus rhinocerous TaxID=307959 RepID=A0A673KA81_9TELE
LHTLMSNNKDEDKEDEKFIDVVINKNMKLGQKILIPVKQFPKEYDDGYGTAYDDQGYDSYDNNYNNQSSADISAGRDYHDRSLLRPEEWTNNRNKAPPARTNKKVFREQPYSRF